MSFLTYLSLTALLTLVRAQYHGLLVAVEDRIESISPLSNSTNILPGAKNVFALSSPVYTEDGSFAFLFATELGCKGPSVYRVEGDGGGHEILHSPRGDNNTNKALYFVSTAYDEVKKTIFLTSGKNKTIFSLSDQPGSTMETFFTDKQKEPTSITLDVCTRTLYWINANRKSPSIEISQLETGETWSLITEDLAKPKALTFDRYERKLYWADVRRNDLVLSRSNPDGSEREELCRLAGHLAFSLAVSSDEIYWTEWSSYSVWRVEKNSGGSCRPQLVRTYPSSKPHGLAVIREGKPPCQGATAPQHIKPESQEQEEKQKEVERKGDKEEEEEERTTEAPEKSSETVSEPGCVNLCVRGECQTGPGGPASCDCEPGWTGSRCEVELCHNFCLHRADCVLIEDQPECLCPPGHHGDRCQLEEILTMPLQDPEGTRTDLPLYIMSGVSGVLTLVIILLSLTIHNLRLRPRVVRKRFISVAGTGAGAGARGTEAKKPSGSCGIPVEDGIQLDIENCCNMTLCETPCFEPPTRGPKKSRKSKSCRGDKASLLDNCDDE